MSGAAANSSFDSLSVDAKAVRACHDSRRPAIRPRRLAVAVCLALCAAMSRAQAPAAAEAPPVEAAAFEPIPSAEPAEVPEEVLVTGEFPGPGMWKVTRADDPEHHVLWILGAPPPLPKKMQWKSTEVEARVRASQEILLGSDIEVKPDERIGFFKGLSLVPAALGARKNPGDAKLADVLEPALYSRWLVQKRRYLGRNNGIERWRPIFAAFELRKEAFDDIGYRESPPVRETIEKIAKKHAIATTRPMLAFTFKAEGIRAKIREFAREELADDACFEMTLALTDALADRATMEARAHAWASGDLRALAELPALPNPNVACEAAIMSSQIAQELVPANISAQLSALWLEAAEKSLAANASTFALLPYTDLMSADGRLAQLRAKGYVVEEPERQSE